MNSGRTQSHTRITALGIGCMLALLAACGGGDDADIAAQATTTSSTVPQLVTTTLATVPTTTTALSPSTTAGRTPVPTTAAPATADLAVTRAQIPEATASYEFEQSSINGTQYANVLRVTSTTTARTVEINAGRSRKRFLGALGITDDQKSASSVQVEISLDNGPPVLSTTVNFGESKAIDLDVTNVLRIKITVLQKNTECCAIVGIGNPRFA